MLGVDGTFDNRVWVLRCVEYPEHDSMTDCCIKAVMHKPSFDVSCMFDACQTRLTTQMKRVVISGDALQF